MDPKEILKFCIQNGLLVDQEILKIISENSDIESAKLIIKNIKNKTSEKVITRQLFEKEQGQVSKVFSDIPLENQEKLQKLKIKLGISIEVSKEVEKVVGDVKQKEEEVEIKKTPYENKTGVKILSRTPSPGKKHEIGDFVQMYRSRFIKMRDMIKNRRELRNLTSINKITGSSQSVSIIGLISDKRKTKNGNLLFDVEDLTGKIRVLVNQNKKELYEQARDIPLDGIIGFRCGGNREILFANDLYYPDAGLSIKKHSKIEEYALFLSDIQCGSKIFLEKNFLEFIKYLNGEIPNTPEVEKIKYIFLVGDVVEGVGIFPRQERELAIKDLEGQYSRLAELLDKIRKDITIIISPGNHDGVRLMEPQPILDEKYAWPLYNLKNVVMTPNPAIVNMGAKKGFEGFDVLVYHGFSYPYYADNVPSLIDEDNVMNKPNLIMKYLLKNRHLAPTHKSTQYFPSENDDMIIENTPDIFVSGHTHKMDIAYYKNILLISAATWEKQNKFQERMANTPDFSKVPMFNLKTREIKILDFNIENIEQEEKIFEQQDKKIQEKLG